MILDSTTLLFIAIYLLVDIAYVMISQPVYKRVIRNIQSAPISFGLVSGILAYATMAIAWFFFVPTMITAVAKMHRLSRAWAGALVGFVLGLALYGVFNFTNAAMFKNWDGPIIARDLAWGISWLTIISAAYGHFTKS